jgi:hypothetical protein
MAKPGQPLNHVLMMVIDRWQSRGKQNQPMWALNKKKLLHAWSFFPLE